MTYLDSWLLQATVLALAAQSTQLLRSMGYLSLAQGAVCGTAAYATVLACNDHSLFVALVWGFGTLVGLSLVFSALTAHLTEELFVVAALALQAGFQAVVSNLTSVTGGAHGLEIPRDVIPSLAGVTAATGVPTWLLIGAALLAQSALLSALVRSDLGLWWRAIGSNPTLAMEQGLNRARLRALGNFISSILLFGPALLILAAVDRIDADSFGFDLSMSVLVCAFLARSGVLVAPVVAAFGYKVVAELTFFLGDFVEEQARAALVLLATFLVLLDVITNLRLKRSDRTGSLG